MGKFGVGQSIRRVEDQRFLTGKGRYTDDISVPGQTYLYILRSTHAHADISALDVSQAKKAPGVVGILIAADLNAMKIGPIPVDIVPPDQDGNTPKPPTRPVLAENRVRYVGEPVAAIIAETISQAKDAAELIEVEYNDLVPVSLPAEAVKNGAPVLHPEAPGNVLVHWHLGDKTKTEKVFEKAEKIVSINLINQRIVPTAIEPRSAIAQYDPTTERFTLTQGCQNTHKLKGWAAQTLGVQEQKIRVLCDDVGGGFGMRYFFFNEPALCLVASKAFGKLVKWTADRSESFLADGHGRDQVNKAELAMDKDGTFRGIRVSSLGNVGAYLSQFGAFVPTMAGCGMLGGAYRIGVASVDVKIVFTNTAPVDAYRGAGRPEAAYLVERLVEKAAHELGMPSIELRRKNLIRADEFPYQTALGPVYDSGRYEELMDAALKRADAAGFEARRAEAKKHGKLRGLGISYYVEACSGGNHEKPKMFFDKNQKLHILIGTQSTGQGHETIFGTVAAEAFGIPLERINVITGDTDLIPTGFGTGGSRSVPIGGSAVMKVSLAMIEQGKVIAADLLEASAVDLEYESGEYKIAGTDRSISLADVISTSFDDKKRPEGKEPGLCESERYKPEGNTFPNGCHICEVDVDESTGVISFVNYTIQDDLGNAMNPLLMEGQIIGGAIQGLGQALFEEAVYDEAGQLITGSFMDYTMPRADNSPSIDFNYTEVPTTRNALGIKGAGEAGTIGATPAVANAVADALSIINADHIDMPFTPLKVWQAIQSAKNHALP
ncbi:MAG: carbon monoxide dehydrogenase [Candidatus Marinimicrobia bacterium]|nr:carbon monoxide dehydrogenase [Candidatus Neomarinimicrobiota bacterium]